MDERVHTLLEQITALQDELTGLLAEQEQNIYFHIKGKSVEFERSVKDAHQQLKMNFFKWLTTNRPQNFITGPVIYSMIIPMIFLDGCVSFYQMTCFPIYKISKVNRADYIVFDRHHLNYLNWIEKFHCTYCAYGAGLIAYITEIVARTEQYFCPIKHARKVLGTHKHYVHFLKYGEAASYQKRLEEFRLALEKPGA